MATYTTYGPWAPSSGASRRMRLRYDWSLGSPSGGSIPVSLTVSVEVGYRVNWRGARLTWGGGMGSDSATVDVIASNGGSRVLWSRSTNAPLEASSYRLSVRMSLSGVGYIGAGVVASHSDGITIPAAGAARPNPPASVATTRYGTSGNQFLVSWSAVPGAERYQVGLYRAADDWVGTLTYTSATQLIDTVKTDGGYQYRVAALNATGSSAWTTGPNVQSAPSAPSISWRRDGQRLLVTVTNPTRWCAGGRIQVRVAGSDLWEPYTTFRGRSGTAPYMPAPGQAVQFRADCWVDQPTDAYSPWATTGWAQVLAAPNPPLLLAPTGVVALDDDLQLTWRHQPVDASPQRAAEIRYRVLGGQWGTRTVTDQQHLVLPLGAGLWEWQARTRGDHADWSGWSPVAGFRVAPRPDLIITAPPPGVWRSNRVTPELDYSDTQAGMSGWEITLRDGDGTELERITGVGAYTPRPLGTVLRDATDYTLEATAQSGTGLSSRPATVRIRAEFVSPATPWVQPRWVEDEGLVLVDAGPGTTTSPDMPATTGLRIESSYDGGRTWALVATGGGQPLTGTDWLPPLGAEPIYRAIATSDLPSEAASAPVAVATPTRRAWLVGDDGTRADLILDPSYSYSHEQGIVLATYEGDVHPTPHYGPGRPEQVQIAGVLTPQHGSPRETWVRLLGQPCWWRDPHGMRWRATLTSGGVTLKPRRGRSRAIDVSATAVRITDD
uniref:Fibronectin type III domain-containing protein n=1 Tax=Dulem virus 32 TaxID=3145750 RepID=A0AAU8B1R0_9CAUD